MAAQSLFLFDNQTEEDQRQIALSLSGDGGDLYYLDDSPYDYMFQVTNEDTYMDFAVSLFQNVINTANDAKIKKCAAGTKSFGRSKTTNGEIQMKKGRKKMKKCAAGTKNLGRSPQKKLLEKYE